MRRHILEFKVYVKSPFIFAGIEASTVGVDVSALRNEYGRPVLPADHLKGLLREAVVALKAEAPKVLNGITLDRLFGPNFVSDRSEIEPKHALDPYAPKRGCLLFGDLVAERMYMASLAGSDGLLLSEWESRVRIDGPEAGTRLVTRIMLDPETGTVARGMLQVVELAAPLAAKVEFKGCILLYASDADASIILDILNLALRLIPYFGGLRTAGFGEHIAEESSVVLLRPEDIVPRQYADADEFDGRLLVEVSLDRPFLVAAERVAPNVFEGSQIIPGGAIKGALAELLRWGDKYPEEDSPHGRVLSKMRIGHAFPIGPIVSGHSDSGETKLDGELGRALPLSAMYDPDPAVRNDSRALIYACAFDADIPGILNGHCADFQPDWKDDNRDAFACHVSRPPAYLSALARGHTKIESDTGTAQTEALFVEVSRGALLDDHKTARRLRFTVDLRGAQHDPLLREAARDIVAILATGVDSIGKSRARFENVMVRTASAVPQMIFGRQFRDRVRWRILLETPALLLDPDRSAQRGAGEGVPTVSESLTAYFDAVVPNAMLAAQYVQRRLVGGYPVLRPLRRRADGDERYRPYSLFVAGSCFLLESHERAADAVANRLAELVGSGLPVLRWKKAGHLEIVDDWRQCPYLPENGYGEISVEDAVFDRIATVRPIGASHEQENS